MAGGGFGKHLVCLSEGCLFWAWAGVGLVGTWPYPVGDPGGFCCCVTEVWKGEKGWTRTVIVDLDEKGRVLIPGWRSRESKARRFKLSPDRGRILMEPVDNSEAVRGKYRNLLKVNMEELGRSPRATCSCRPPLKGFFGVFYIDLQGLLNLGGPGENSLVPCDETLNVEL